VKRLGCNRTQQETSDRASSVGRQHDEVRTLMLNMPMKYGASVAQLGECIHMLAGELLDGELPQPLFFESSRFFR